MRYGWIKLQLEGENECYVVEHGLVKTMALSF